MRQPGGTLGAIRPTPLTPFTAIVARCMMAALPRLVVVEGPWRGIEIALTPSPQVLGRDPSCELAVPDTALSRRHLRLVPQDGGWILEDLGSSNGTEVNGARVDRVELQDGDVIGAGRCLLRFDVGDHVVVAGARTGRTTVVTAIDDAEHAADRDDLGRLARLADVLVDLDDAEDIGLRFAQWVREQLGVSRVVLFRRRHGRLVVAHELPASSSTSTAGLLPAEAAAMVCTEGKTLCTELDDGEIVVAVPVGAPAELVVAASGVASRPTHERMRLLACAGHVAAGLLLSRLRERVAPATRTDGRDTELVAQSPSMQPVLEFIERAGPADATVLVLGESGSGKEMIARALHRASGRASGAFVAINCAAIAETLLESELFGHERGAFTGATARRAGRFEQAHGGTLLLDEVGELSPHAQAGLLRVLEESCVHRVGGAESIPVDVRVIAATHRDLEADVAAGRFREDLYFRLAVLVARVPPLRERPEDIAVLARSFFNHFRGRAARSLAGISASAMTALISHPWPGNVRQLRNAMERAVILGRSRMIECEDLPPEIGGRTSTRASDRPLALPMAAAELERANILAALDESGGNKSRAARLLGMDRATLYNRLRSYAVDDSTTTDE